MGAQLYGYLPYSERPTGKKQQEWWPIKGSYQTDGTILLKVDTELELDAGNIYINNLKVGSVDQTKTNTRFLRTTDDGSIIVKNLTEIEKYEVADTTIAGNPKYHGFVDFNENWFIIEETLVGSTREMRYSTGQSNYTAAWTGRTGLTYDYLFNVTIY